MRAALILASRSRLLLFLPPLTSVLGAGLTAVTLLTALTSLPGEPALPLAAELPAPDPLVWMTVPSVLFSLLGLVALVLPLTLHALVLLPAPRARSLASWHALVFAELNALDLLVPAAAS